MCFTPLTRKLVYTFIFPTNHFRTNAQREREREREEITHSHTRSTLFLTPSYTFKPFQENFSPHSLSSLTPSPSRRTERAIADEAQIQSLTHNSASLITPLKPIADLITPPQTHLWWTQSNRAHLRLRLHLVISPLDRTQSPPPRDLTFASAARSHLNLVASLSSFFSQFDRIWWFFFSWVLFLLCFWDLMNIIYLFGSWENVSNK